MVLPDGRGARGDSGIDHVSCQRENLLIALRSLFGHCKKTRTIFRNPTSRIKVGQRKYGLLQPLRPDDVDQAVTVATTPAARLVLALAAVHAARTKQNANFTSTTSTSATGASSSAAGSGPWTT